MTTGVSSTKMRAGTPSSTGKKKDLGHQPSSRASEGRDHASLFSYSERGDSLCASVYDDTTSREDSISREDTTSSESDDQKRKPRRRGRPPGAKNLPKDLPKDSPKGPPKMRGRPWGSKNKIKPWQLREQLIDPMGRLRMEETEQLPLAPIIAAQSHRRAPIHTSDSPRTIVPLRFSGVEPNNYLSMEPSKRRRLTEANLLEFIVSAQSTEKEAQKADVSPLPTVAAGAIPPPLPPSVEEAYRKKCIELKRRMTEVEESNDGCRLRKARLQRGIRKMRLERAYLLEILAKRMKKNGGSIDGFQCIYDEESDGSSEAPPTV